MGFKALSPKFKLVEHALLPDDRADEFYPSAHTCSYIAYHTIPDIFHTIPTQQFSRKK
jgi:hypothetical protein